MATRILRAAAGLSALWFAGCSTPSTGGGECVPGLVVTCSCADGEGAKVCGPDGKFEACACGQTGGVPDPTGQADFLIDFGTVAVGDHAQAVLPLRNTGATTLQFQPGPVEPPFQVGNAAPLLLAPGESGQLVWTFWPAALGTSSFVGRVASNGGAFTVRLFGAAFEPELRCTPAAVDFGTVSRERVTGREVVCVNEAAHPWAMVALPMTGADPDRFGVGPIPAAPVEAGGSWRFEVTAIAAGPGPISATLPLATAAGRVAGSLALVAEGDSGGLTCTPALLDFGFVAPGASRLKDLVCQNYSIDPVQLTSMTLDPSSDRRFSWPVTESPIEIPGRVGEAVPSVSIPVLFSPQPEDHGRLLNGVMNILTNDPGLPRVDVRLSGFAGGPSIACSPAALDYGTVAVGLPATLTFVCTNDGEDDPTRPDDTLLVQDLATSNPEFHAFVRSGVEPGGYGIGETFTVEVSYDPVDDGRDDASVRLFTNATNAPEGHFDVPVSGLGRDLPPCDFDVLPAQLRFGIVDRGQSATLDFAVKNHRADAECLIRDLRLAPTCGAEFSLPAGDVALEALPPNGELRVPVKFSPRAYGSFNCDVLFDISDPAGPHRVVPVRGASQESCASIVPGDLDFGTVKPGCATTPRELQIINTCSAPLVLGSIEPAESPSGEFFLRMQPAPGTVVQPGLSATFSMDYRPADEGSDLGAVYVYVNGTAEPYLATLRGRAALDALQTDSFEQHDQPKADVLFVIDDATAGNAELELQFNLAAFLSFAQAQMIDYQIGVTTASLPGASGNCGGEDGRLVPINNSRPRILTPNTPNLQAAWTANIQGGFPCTGVGLELEAASRALQPPVSDHCDDPRHPEFNDGNCGFLRPAAHLSIIAVTRAADLSLGSDDSYYRAFLGLKGARSPHLFNFHAITGDRGVGCTSTSGNALAGDRLISMAERTRGGIFRSICTDGWGNLLRDLSAAAFGAETCFFLRGPPEDTNGNGTISAAEDELEVRLNGIVTPPVGSQGEAIWRYDADQMAVCFQPRAPPQPGTQIDVQYRVACVSW